MSHITHIGTRITVTPPPVEGTQVNVAHEHFSLMHFGFNLLVEISPAGLLVERQKSVSNNSITVVGHFDTGASRTAIDTSVARHLKLTSIGASSSFTAAGVRETPDYTVNMSFTGSSLRQILNMRVGSCNLPFNINESHSNPENPKNIGLLIGRDIMSLWNITWHGPSSTVLISD